MTVFEKIKADYTAKDFAEVFAEIYYMGTMCHGCRFENKSCTICDCKQKWLEEMNEEYKENEE